MRSPYVYGLLAMLLAGCSDEAAIKSEKKTAASGREEVTIRMAHATESAGDYPGAEKMYVQAVSQSPDTPAPQIELAEFYKRHREERKAIESLSAALRLLPGNTELERELANTYIGLAEPEKALDVLKPAIAGNARDPLLYNSQGVALDQIGSYAEAQQSYKTAYDLDPSGGMMYKINSSMSYILSGSYGKAITLLRPMLDVPDAPPIIRQNLALAYGLKGESQTAMKLGLQDLSESEAAENVRFYRMLARRHNAAAGNITSDKAGAAPVSPSVVKDLFPDEEPSVAAAPVVPVSPAPSASVPAPAIITPAPAAVIPAAPVAAVPLPPPAPVVEVVPSPMVSALPAHKAAPKASASLAKPEADEEDDDNDDAPTPVIKPAIPARLKPVATMAPSAGDEAVAPVAPGEDSLPEPVLKPDTH